MSCTPEQCAELQATLVVLQAELVVITAELGVLESEKTATEGLIETVAGCIDFCECNQAMSSSGEERKALTPEMKSRIEMLPLILRMVRKNRPAVESPKQV